MMFEILQTNKEAIYFNIKKKILPHKEQTVPSRINGFLV